MHAAVGAGPRPARCLAGSEARSATREEIEALVCVNTEVNSWYYGFWYNGLLYEGEYGVPEEYYY